MACQPFNDEVDASLLFDNLQQTTRHHGDDNEFAHAQYAVTHSLHPSEDVKRSVADAYESRQHDAKSEYSHHVHAENGSDKYYQVGNHLHEGYFANLSR